MGPKDQLKKLLYSKKIHSSVTIANDNERALVEKKQQERKELLNIYKYPGQIRTYYHLFKGIRSTTVLYPLICYAVTHSFQTCFVSYSYR